MAIHIHVVKPAHAVTSIKQSLVLKGTEDKVKTTVFLYLIAAYASARQCVIIIWENLGVTQAYTLNIQLLRWRGLSFH
jgi:hypothetical protein